jgi:signal transduction histidine kinase/ActR/RegA family two-component response regulator
MAGAHDDAGDEAAWHENEQRLQALLDHISCGVIVHGADTHIIDANPAACRVTGLTLDQMRGKVAIDPYWCFLEEDGSVMPLERFPVPQVLARGSAVNRLVLGVRRPDLPRPLWVQVDAYPLRDGQGQISQVVVTFADITELKQAEDSARRLNRSLRVLGSGNISLAGVQDEDTYLGQVCEAVVAAGGFLLSCVILANRDDEKSARIVALAGPAAQYARSIDLSWDEHRPTGRGPFGVAVRTGRTQVNQDWRAGEAMAPWRDAALRHGFKSSIALPLTAAGEVIGILSLYAAEVGTFNPEEVPPLEELARNVSVAIETLRTRQQRDLAEGANRAKSEFLANMSHEIRTPLNAIVGLNYLMRRDGVTPEQSARLDKIDSASKHLLSLINDILDLSKIEAGRVLLENVNFRLSAVLDAVASIVAESARAKGLAIETDADAVPHWLCGDPTRLRQALLNLAGNAIKFTDRGTIALRAKLLEDRGDDLHVRFSVEDTGIGIAAEHIPRLFQAFEQADASITRRFGGTGLGLAITKRLTEAMGGECGVESRPGQGSTFWFTAVLQRGHGTLPAPASGGTATAESLLRLRHRGTRILVAEDNTVNQEVLLAMLHGVGLDADVASNGQQAVAMAQAADYGMVLMDMQMPLMGGLEATRVIRALPGWQRRPILALTANAFDDDRQACKASGMNDFIVKPVDAEALYATILVWLDASDV